MMTYTKSLGLHEPTALRHLIAESILPQDPPQSLYSWETFSTYDEQHNQDVEEELLTTERCVAWSRGGVVQRIYNLHVEGEPILKTFTTQFVVSSLNGSEVHGEAKSSRPGSLSARPNTVPTSIRNGNTSGFMRNDSRLPQSSPVSSSYGKVERGLVVILRSQAHIFLLSGDSHVIPLFFEVETAFPMSKGFILQRKLREDEIVETYHPAEAATDERDSIRARSFPNDRANATRPSLVLPKILDSRWMRSVKPIGSMPRTFYFVEILSELGLVVSTKARPRRDATGSDIDDVPLSRDERLVYVSPRNEIQQLTDSEDSEVSLAITVNPAANTLSCWQLLRFTQSRGGSPARKTQPELGDRINKRKSSNVYGRMTGAATPVARAGGQIRESFGVLAQSYAESLPYQDVLESKTSRVDDLFTELGQEFGTAGVQTRSARRVSSMLARSDLAMGHDRTTFNDLAPGHPSRKSMNRSVRRGDSIGSFSDRQSFGPRRRSSFQGNESITTNGTSFLGISSHRITDDSEAHHDLLSIEHDEMSAMATELPRDVQLLKVKTLPYTGPTSALTTQSTAIKVSVLPSPEHVNPSDGGRGLSVWIMNNESKDLAVISLSVRPNTAENSDSYTKTNLRHRIKSTDSRMGLRVLDVCKICEGPTSRMIILTRTMDGRGILHLEAPWTSPLRLDLPAKFVVFDPYSISAGISENRRRETGLNRVMADSNTSIAGLKAVAMHGQFVIVDTEQNSHRVQLWLQPRDGRIGRILNICSFVLATAKNDGLLLAWWEILRWLRLQGPEQDAEWTAMVVLLFANAVPFIDEKSSQGSLTQRRKKNSLLRSTSGTPVDLEDWNTLSAQRGAGTSTLWGDRGGWKWMTNAVRDETSPVKSPPSPTRSRKPANVTEQEIEAKNNYMVRCVALAREFLQTPAGETAIGPEGYLPTAMSKSRELRRTAVAAILVGIHLAREEEKLNILASTTSSHTQQDLTPILAQLGQWLGWNAWTWKHGTYYGSELAHASKWLFEDSRITALEMPGQPFEPPTILEHLERCINEPEQSPFPTLLDVAGYSHVESTSHPLWRTATRLTPRTFALITFMAQVGRNTIQQSTIQAMLNCGIDGPVLETLPDGVAAAFHRAITSQRSNPPQSWNPPVLDLLDRGDLKTDERIVQPKSKPHPNSSHEAARDYHSIGNVALDSETLHLWDASSEIDRQSIIRLIFREDRRFQEASKLVNQTRPPVVECNPEPEWTEADLLDAQKELVQYVTRRTLSVAAGRGMMHFNARVPLLTERVPIPAFSLQCVMKSRHGHGTESSQSGMTFSADKAAFTEDKACWAFFHNGASAGLMISKDAKGIDPSWILYNKPPELTNRHAGFLLALGLNGHLKNLAKWVTFKYLTPKHTMTSIGILLGLSASYLGTMDTMTTRLLSVHVTRLLPIGAAELNLSGLVQTSGIVGVGLVYWGSGHRRMSEVMLSEIENCEVEEPIAGSGAGGEEGLLRDEGYRLAAGFALGLINLGQGKRLDGLRDMVVLERLLTVAVGTKNVDCVNVLDRATAGGVIAVAFIWLKTNDEAVAKKIDIPDTIHQFDYVRPDIFLLRTLARHLILWDAMEATPEFVETSLPRAYRHRASLRATKYLSTEDMPFFNIVAGICFALGLKFAGSMDTQVRNLLVSYLDQFIRLTRLPALNYDAKLTRNSVRNCQDVVALATATVMAGSGDLIVLRRLRSLHGRTDADTPYGSHLAGHMAIGALFLGGGTATFATSNLAVAALVMSFYPVFPTSVLDNKGHLQALRHLWVLAVERRCVVGREVGGGRPVSVEMKIKLKSGEERDVMTPGLLPDLSLIQSLEVKGGEYWDVQLDFSRPETRAAFNRDQSVWLRRRAAYDRPVGEVFVAELQALDEASETPGVHSTTAQAGWKAGQGRSAFEWLFGLRALGDFDHAERALVLPPHGLGMSGGEKLLKGTVVDTRLELEKGILEEEGTGAAMNRDQLWQLRLLFAWVDQWDEVEAEAENGGEQVMKGSGTWLRREVIDRLRWRVWKMASGEGGEGL